MESLKAFQFLRPEWLWALLATPAVAWLWRARRPGREGWADAVDAHLLRHLVATRDGTRRLGGLLPAAAFALAVLALAGPSWRQLEQPLWQNRTPLVVALDLSSAATAADLPPSRLAQARAKLRQLLEHRRDGHIALVAYADDAYTVSPLTEDPANVALYLDALAPDIMPIDGRRTERAIAWSQRLLERAGFPHGDIVLMTGDTGHAAVSAAERAAQAGFRVSVLGLGTSEGVSYRRRNGSIATARLDAAALQALARAGNGEYAALAPGPDDLAALGLLDAARARAGIARDSGARVPVDDGYWLLLPLMALFVFAFRRHAGVLLLAGVMLSTPWMAQAQARPKPEPQGAPQGTWWRRVDQVAHARLQAGNDAYVEGDYARAAELYEGLDSPDAHYNRGNALARAGRYRAALDAYDEALRQRPGMPDAIANRRAVEALLKRQPPGPRQDPERGRQDPKQAPTRPGEQGEPTEADQGEPRGRKEPDQADDKGAPESPKPPAPDPAAQRAADAAQRERMEQALRQGGQGRQGRPTDEPAPSRDTPVERERKIANEAWLKRVPDDPGALLAEKFRLERERRQLRGEVE